MQINVRKDILFLFAIFLIAGIDASSQSEQDRCVLKVFVNDPSARIFVDGKEMGTQPLLIACSEQEKNITVKSSDGQVFSRLMKAKHDFDLTNSVLNVVFHSKVNYFEYKDGLSSKNMAAAENSIPVQNVQVSQPVRNLGSAPQQNVETLQTQSPVETLSLQKHVNTSSSQQLAGTYIQLFALKNLDMSKVEQDIELNYNSKNLPQEITVCSWQASSQSQVLSLVLVGPFSSSALALKTRNTIGGKSFLVTDPRCRGELTKVRR